VEPIVLSSVAAGAGVPVPSLGLCAPAANTAMDAPMDLAASTHQAPFLPEPEFQRPVDRDDPVLLSHRALGLASTRFEPRHPSASSAFHEELGAPYAVALGECVDQSPSV